MNWSHRGMFCAVLMIAMLTGVWSSVCYSITSSVFSDLGQHGVSPGSESYKDVVVIAKRQIRLVAMPLATVLILSLTGWGYSVFRPQSPSGSNGVP